MWLLLRKNYLGAKPQLTGQIILNYVIWKFHTKITTGAFGGNQFVHDFDANRQDLMETETC